MDINTVRIIIEVISLTVFVAIVVWAYNPRRRAALERTARSVLED